MKKFIITIFAVFYLGVSSGATVHFHYCMGKLVEWGLQSKQASKCSKCGMKKNVTKNCCKHENTKLKVDVVQKTSENLFQVKAPCTDLKATTFLEIVPVDFTSVHEEFPKSNAPPAKPKVAAFIQNCNFRI